MHEAAIKRMTAAEAAEYLAGPIDDVTDHGRCTGCGQCCGNFLPLTKDDVARIRKYVKKNRIRPVDRLNAALAGPSVDMMCPFLDDAAPAGKKCRIYEVRPFICRHYVCSVNSDPVARDRIFREMAEELGATFGQGEIPAAVAGAEQLNVRKTFFPKSPDNNVNPKLHAKLDPLRGPYLGR